MPPATQRRACRTASAPNTTQGTSQSKKLHGSVARTTPPTADSRRKSRGSHRGPVLRLRPSSGASWLSSPASRTRTGSSRATATTSSSTVGSSPWVRTPRWRSRRSPASSRSGRSSGAPTSRAPGRRTSDASHRRRRRQISVAAATPTRARGRGREATPEASPELECGRRGPRPQHKHASVERDTASDGAEQSTTPRAPMDV